MYHIIPYIFHAGFKVYTTRKRKKEKEQLITLMRKYDTMLISGETNCSL